MCFLDLIRQIERFENPANLFQSNLQESTYLLTLNYKYLINKKMSQFSSPFPIPKSCGHVLPQRWRWPNIQDGLFRGEKTGVKSPSSHISRWVFGAPPRHPKTSPHEVQTGELRRAQARVFVDFLVGKKMGSFSPRKDKISGEIRWSKLFFFRGGKS